MPQMLKELYQLSEILAAEAEGRPVDCEQAQRLAEQLGQAYPGIRRTMDSICQRMRG